MQIGRTLNFTLFTIILCFSFSSCSNGQNKINANKKESENNNITQKSADNITNLLKKQILLTNEAQFTKNRTLEGASGFLIKYKDMTFAVTAKHLLGDAGGVEPEISLNELSKSFIKWEMMPRVVANPENETVKLDAKDLDFSQIFSDILLLKVTSKNFEIEPLLVNFDLPKVGEVLYLIGCPYSQTKCKQNIYEVEYAEYENSQNLLIGVIKSKDNLSGFSGAPLLNSKGEVVGVLVGGGEFEGENFVTATHIKEIEKIKF